MTTLKLILVGTFSLIATWTMATTYTVTNTNDAGAGSLRQAISDANVTPGTHTIAFNIPTSDPNYIAVQGVWKITPATALPLVMRSSLTIDGSSQTVNQGNTNLDGPEIMLDGNHAFGSDFAFHLYNVTGVTVQGFIIGRFTVGIEISGSTSQSNIIRGNYIGCNYNATDTLSNTHGIEILTGPHHNTIGGSTPADRNILSGNNHTGVRVVNSNYNIIKGNYVGLNRTGTAALRNYDGISIEGTSKNNLIGGYTAADRNYVSGNVAYGIPVFGGGCSGNIIVGNYAGTDITGTVAVPNTYGVLFDDGASFNTLGGTKPGAGNLLSGNSGYGVFIYNPGTQRDTVVGNLIGTNATATAALPNANGIVIDGPSYRHFVDSNIISGNLQMGIDIHIGGSDSNVVTRNYIGTNAGGTLAIPNHMDGIRIGEGPRHNFIGLPGKGNIIAFNGGNGISVMTLAELYNTTSGNSIYDNDGLGIDLFPEGVTLNDAGDGDSGPNDGLNFPVIDTVYFFGSDVIISGHLDVATPATTHVELFIAAPDVSGYGEGKTFLGSTSALANGSWCDTVSGVLSTDFITATALDAAGNTSEFSANAAGPVAYVFELEQLVAQVTIFPNPFTENVEIRVSSKELHPATFTVHLFNSAGVLVDIKEGTAGRAVLQAGSLAAGSYLCRITFGGIVLPAVRLVKE